MRPAPVLLAISRIQCFQHLGKFLPGDAEGKFIILLCNCLLYTSILRLGFQRSGGDGGHHLAQHPCTHGSHAVKQLAAGLLRVNGDLLAAEHIAGVKALQK